MGRHRDDGMKRTFSKTDLHPPLTSSKELERLAFRFLIAGSVKCGRGWTVPQLEHHHHRLLVVRGGAGELLLGNRSLPLQRGHVLLGLPGERYGVRQNPQKRLVTSVVRFEVLTADKKIVRLSPFFRRSLCSEVKCFPLLEELMLRLTNAIPSVPCAATGLTAALLRAILWLVREDQHSEDDLQAWNTAHESLRPVLQYEPPAGGREPGTAELARLCGMSVSTFGRRMRMRFGASPKKVLIQRRIERAKVLLLESHYTIEAIAAELGYKEPGHFTRQFKKIVGLSPSAFRVHDS